MARPRKFDEGEVLRAARDQFWSGYAGTSVDDVLTATGLGKGSLYGAFGDKRALFLRALALYLDTALRERMARLQCPEAGKAEILALFRGVARDALGDRERKGCMVTNCSIELADRDPDLACQAARSLDLFERAFAGAIRQAQAGGDIGAGRDPVRLARFLTVCMEGMLVLARVRPDAAWLDDAVSAVEEALC